MVSTGVERRRMSVTAAAICWLLSCNSSQVGPQLAPAALVSTEVNVRTFGARGDGQTNDTEAFSAALRSLGSEGTLYVPAGTYILKPIGGAPRGAIELTRPMKLTVRGDGMNRTSIQMAPGVYRGDTHLIYLLETSGITIRDLALDGNRLGASFSDEQNHCVEVSRSSDITFERVLFHFCRGDGIRFLAPPFDDALWTERVTVKDSRFEDNGRSGIAVQRAVRNLTILNNTFTRISDQSIDIEPTGSRAPTDVRIEGNVIRHTSTAWAIAIGGIESQDVAQRLTFRNNRIENGAVSFGKANDVLIEGNTILGDPFRSALRLAKNVTNVMVRDNDISGRGGQDEGLIMITSLNGVFPSNVTLENNRITASGGQAGIYVQDALHDIEIVENVIRGTGASSGVSISNIALIGSRPRFTIHNNDITDFIAGIRFSTRGDSFMNVRIQENSLSYGTSSTRETIGILFSGTGPYQIFATVTPNAYGPGIERAILVRSR